jgi:hypothetical protein
VDPVELFVFTCSRPGFSKQSYHDEKKLEMSFSRCPIMLAAFVVSLRDSGHAGWNTRWLESAG